MSRAFASYFTILCLGFLRAQSADEKTIVVSGNVVDSVTGRGIPGALVQVNARPSKALAEQMNRRIQEAPNEPRGFDFKPPSPLRLITNATGGFSTTIPEPVSLQVAASKSLYQAGIAASYSTFDQENAAPRNIVLKLEPLGAIEGRVVNGDGEPIPGLNVQILTGQVANGHRIFESNRSVSTNDLGEYRMWNLAAGPVYVKVSGKLGSATGLGVTPSFADTSEAYGPLYFPSSPDRTTAQPVRVQGGTTVRADFKIDAQPAFHIRGKLQNLDSYNRSGLRLLRAGDPIANRVSVDVTSGSFTVFDVTPGDYILQAYCNAGATVAFGQVAVIVGKGDLNGVAVPMNTGVDVSGVVERPPRTNLGIPDDLSSFERLNARFQSYGQVTAQLINPGELPVRGTQPPAQIDEQGRFTLKDMLPGKYLISMDRFGLQQVSSIRSGNVDVLADGLTVTTSSPPELRIVMHQGGAQLKVKITGISTGNFAMIGAINSAGVAVVSPAPGTDFPLPPIEPGDYTIYAWPATHPLEYANPEALRAVASYGVPVKIREDTPTEITVTVIPEDLL